MTKLSACGIIPVYNNSETLEESIQSFLDQSLPLQQLIIIDDNSSDKSLSIIKSFKDSRIKILTNSKRIGTSASFNRAIPFVTSDVILSHGGDDISSLTRWQIQSNYFNDPELGVLASSFNLIDDHNNFLNLGYASEFVRNITCCSDLFQELFWHSNFICAPSVAIRTKYFKDKGLFPPTLQMSNDFIFWLFTAQENKLKISDDIVVNYRRSSQTLSGRGTSIYSYLGRISRFEHFTIYMQLFDSLNFLDCKKLSKTFHFEPNKVLLNDQNNLSVFKINIFLSHPNPIVKEVGIFHLLKLRNFDLLDISEFTSISNVVYSDFRNRRFL